MCRFETLLVKCVGLMLRSLGIPCFHWKTIASSGLPWDNAATQTQMKFSVGGLKMADEPVPAEHWADSIALPMSPEQWDSIQKGLAEALQAKERVEGIVYLCSLDLVLEQLLRAVMIDDESVDELMKEGQALQSFSIKLRLAYALGLIPEAMRKDLMYLNKIRNEFAHNGEIKSFDEAPICDWCANLSTMKGRDGISLPSRLAYRVAVAQSARFLLLEYSLRLKEKMLHQNQRVDSVESRYAAYLDARNQPAK